MKYYEVRFEIRPMNEDGADVLAALLAEAGFEAFETTSEGLTAYVQQAVWNTETVETTLASYPLPHHITYTRTEAPDENWNQTWEEEGFAPVILDRLVCVHDTKHQDVPVCQYDILINPRMAFGTGTHPTTQMILRLLAELDLTGKRVIDAGCGTGVLGILALKRGAKSVFAYDIDEWSVENSRTNFELNGFMDIDVALGDSKVLAKVKDYDLLIANINRNILLADMGQFHQALAQDGELILSGFYTEDIPLLQAEAAKYHKIIKERRVLNDWALLLLG